MLRDVGGPRELSQQREHPIENGDVAGPVVSRLGDGQLEKLGQVRAPHHHPNPVVRIAQDVRPQIASGELAQQRGAVTPGCVSPSWGR